MPFMSALQTFRVCMDTRGGYANRQDDGIGVHVRRNRCPPDRGVRYPAGFPLDSGAVPTAEPWAIKRDGGPTSLLGGLRLVTRRGHPRNPAARINRLAGCRSPDRSLPRSQVVDAFDRCLASGAPSGHELARQTPDRWVYAPGVHRRRRPVPDPAYEEE